MGREGQLGWMPVQNGLASPDRHIPASKAKPSGSERLDDESTSGVNLGVSPQLLPPRSPPV